MTRDLALTTGAAAAGAALALYVTPRADRVWRALDYATERALWVASGVVDAYTARRWPA